MKRKNKSAQLTIFVIIGIVLVAAIGLTFFLMNKSSGGGEAGEIALGSTDNPEAYISNCLQNALTASEKELIESNLFPNMTSNYIIYYGEKVKYLCKTSQFYMPCVNQEPMLIETLRDKIKAEVEKDAKKCFATLTADLKKKNEVSESGSAEIKISFAGNDIVADFSKTLIVKTGEAESRKYDKFSDRISSPLYKLVNNARQIVNFESTLCEFDAMSWMNTYKDIGIKKFVASEGSKIYTITDKPTEKEIKFAVKTCVMPAGI